MKKIFMILVICFTAFSLQAEKKLKESELPKNIVVLSQNMNNGFLMITAVDLSNNEMVMIHYERYEMSAFRTGIIVDMSKQKAIEGTSSSDDE